MHDGTYSFEIQLSNPQLTYVFDSEVESMDGAIETIFPMETEYAIVKWNYRFIPIGYKYDVSCLYNDFREIINFCKKNNTGTYQVHFYDDTFFAEWFINVEGDGLVIDTKWFNVLGDLEDLLNQRPRLVIEKEEFIKELEKLINFVDKCLIECGYKEFLERVNTFK